VRVLCDPGALGEIVGAAGAWLVPSDDRELVRQRRQLWLPAAMVDAGTVHEHQQGPVAGAVICDLEAVRPNDLHSRNLPLRDRSGQSAATHRRSAPLDEQTPPRNGVLSVALRDKALAAVGRFCGCIVEEFDDDKLCFVETPAGVG
jgi:hypothetical protein